MTPVISHAKSILREHRYSRGLYRILGRQWNIAGIYFNQAMFGRYHTAERFDQRFSKTADPWCYCTDPLQEERRELILELLPRNHYPRLLEIGCAAGWMTPSLANRTDELSALDVSAVALAHARNRCRQMANVTFRQLDLLIEPINGSFDCIICAGVLRYLPANAQRLVRDHIVDALAISGDLLLENLRDPYPAEVPGTKIHALFRQHPELIVLQHKDVGDYAITTYRKVTK